MYLSIEKIVQKYKQPIRGVIHIGAHFGEEYNSYIQNGIYNLHFFEASRKNFEKLVKHVGLSCVYNFALGCSEGTAELFVESMNQGQSNSLLEPALHLQQYPQIVFDQREEVKMRALDSFEITTCNFINIDVQGYELEVLKGSEKTLAHVDYVYSEVNRAETYKGCAQIEDMDNFLDNKNFKRVETMWPGGIWGDALWVKK
jgi:FkbM family methyltransferase